MGLLGFSWNFRKFSATLKGISEGSAQRQRECLFILFPERCAELRQILLTIGKFYKSILKTRNVKPDPQ